MKRHIIWCAALLLFTACGGQTANNSSNKEISGKDSAKTTDVKIIELEFNGIPDSVFAGKWVSINSSDSIEFTLNPDGSVSTKGLSLPYLNWKQEMANVIVLTRPGTYAGTVVDTADIDVDACPMILSVRGSRPLKLLHK